MNRADLITKVYHCLDEIYPDLAETDLEQFGVDSFLDEGAMTTIKVCPLYALGEGTDFKNAEKVINEDGNGHITLPVHSVRLIGFRMSDWRVPFKDTLHTSDKDYWMQINPVLRGTPSRPKAFFTDGNKELEFYSTKAGEEASVTEARVFCFDKVGDDFPDLLANACAWKTAELVCTAQNNKEGYEFASLRFKEAIQVL